MDVSEKNPPVIGVWSATRRGLAVGAFHFAMRFRCADRQAVFRRSAHLGEHVEVIVGEKRDSVENEAQLFPHLFQVSFFLLKIYKNQSTIMFLTRMDVQIMLFGSRQPRLMSEESIFDAWGPILLHASFFIILFRQLLIRSKPFSTPPHFWPKAEPRTYEQSPISHPNTRIQVFEGTLFL